MKTFTKTLEKIFYILFFLFALGVLFMAKHRIPYIEGTATQVGVQIVIFILLVIILFSVYIFVRDDGDWKRDIVGLSLVSLVIRFVVILLVGLDTNQVSDFGTAYAIGLSDIPFKSHKGVNFPHWGMYSIYIKMIISLFGEGYLTIIIWNAIWSTISVCLIYNLCRLYEKGRKKAILAALVFCIWPAYLSYTIILTPEHLNIVFVLLALNIFVYSYRCKENIKKQSIALVLSGCILGVSNFFKPISIIVLVAMVIILCLKLPEIMEKGKSRETIKKVAKKITILSFCFIIAYTLTRQTGDNIIEYCYGRNINPDVTLYFMATGLSSESQGRYWPEFSKAYLDCIGENGDYASASVLAKEVLRKELIDLQDNWLFLFKEKVGVSWQTDDYMGFVLATINSDGKSLVNVEQWYDHLMWITYFWYMAVWLMVGIVVLINIFRKGKNNILFFFSILFVFGMACLQLISECQARYKCVIYPYLAVAAAYGIGSIIGVTNDAIKLIREKFRKIWERKG